MGVRRHSRTTVQPLQASLFFQNIQYLIAQERPGGGSTARPPPGRCRLMGGKIAGCPKAFPDPSMASTGLSRNRHILPFYINS